MERPKSSLAQIWLASLVTGVVAVVIVVIAVAASRNSGPDYHVYCPGSDKTFNKVIADNPDRYDKCPDGTPLHR